MWAVNEFSLKGVDFQKFCMNGAALCALGKDCFLELAPDFVGDILWEHLEILQKGKQGLSRRLEVVRGEGHSHTLDEECEDICLIWFRAGTESSLVSSPFGSWRFGCQP